MIISLLHLVLVHYHPMRFQHWPEIQAIEELMSLWEEGDIDDDDMSVSGEASIVIPAVFFPSPTSFKLVSAHITVTCRQFYI